MKIVKRAARDDAYDIIELDENEYLGRVVYAFKAQAEHKYTAIGWDGKVLFAEIKKLGITPEIISLASGVDAERIARMLDTGFPITPPDLSDDENGTSLEKYSRLHRLLQDLSLNIMRVLCNTDLCLWGLIHANNGLVKTARLSLDTIAVFADIPPEKLYAYAPEDHTLQNPDALTVEEKLRLSLAVQRLQKALNISAPKN